MAEDNLMFEYFVPIKESAEIDGDFTINGVAINETITSNGHKFLGEVLRSSAHTLIGVPLLKDHNNSVDSIVGKVSGANFDEALRNIPFSAVVKDEKMKQLIRDGLLNTVSVGAHVDPKNIEEDESGNIIPKEIVFKELSLVAVPADSGATFTVALNNAYKGLHSQNENQIIERGNENMTEEEIKTEDESTESEPTEKEAEEPVVTEEKVKSWVTEAILAIKSADEDEAEAKPEVEPEAKEEAKEEEDEEEEEEDEADEEVEEGDYKILSGHNSFTMERKSYNYN